MTSTLSLNTERAWNFTKQCPAYSPTPIKELVSPDGFPLLIKDESARFNLGAFKALGGIYAIAMFLKDRWHDGMHSELDAMQMFETDFQDWSKQFTFICASAGNHGMAVAKGAQLFNTDCRVHLADTVPDSFEQKLTELGATVIRSGATYEDSMHAAQNECDGGHETTILLSDSSWPGYLEMPTFVMEGYTVLAEEMRQEFEQTNRWPSHVFLQAGVGGLAAAVAYHIRNNWDKQPQIIVVEPEAAPCLKESVERNAFTTVKGPMSTMGRLDCKEPSLLALDSLRQTADKFVCISDTEADAAVSYLAKHGIATTPSGAAGVSAILVAKNLGVEITKNEMCLAIVTEGLV